MQPTEDEILTALAHYRATIRQHNHLAFQRFVRHAETAEPAPETASSMSARGIADARTRSLYRLLDVDEHPDTLDPALQLSAPGDVHAKWEALEPAFALDGAHVRGDEEQRARLRAAYKSGIETGLRRAGVGDLLFPADFAVLVGAVDSLEGHGWPLLREEGRQTRVWEGLGEDADDVADRVYGPDDDLAEEACMGQEGWEALAGWECGRGPEMKCFAVYCRKEDAGEEWAWRYVTEAGQYGWNIFDNVVELLRWYERENMPGLWYLDNDISSYMGDIFNVLPKSKWKHD
ncbi:hypothetical protein F4804DRAFT_348415 [Jackrogersella minutella]|nr:hypothetical protein F4804DRAFT_348415 [Jackrogersella minutella]